MDGLSILDPSCFTQDTIHSRLVGPRASLDGCGEENISCYHCSLHSKKWHQFYNKTECIKLLQKKISPCTYIITSCSCLVHVPDVYWKCPTNFHLPLNLLLWCIEHKTLGMLVPLYLPLYWTIYGICQFYNKKNVAIFLQTVFTDLGEIFQGILIHRINVSQLSNYKVKHRSTSC